jgi:predicted nucleic acid-binding protein
MPFQPLPQIPNRSDVFIDANIFVYGLSGQSTQCKQFLERCSREEVTGICLYEIVNEATHRFMLAEAKSRGLISRESASNLRKRFGDIPALTDYWGYTERILNLNLLFIGTDESILRSAHSERQIAGLLTNDSMIVSCMRHYGILSLATNDGDFERVSNISVFRPADLP